TAHQPFEAEVEVAGAVGGAHDTAVDGHAEGPGELGHRVGRVRRDPGDRHAEALGDVEVDVVEPGGALGDEVGAAGRQGLQDAVAQGAVDAGGHGLVAGGDGRGVL